MTIYIICAKIFMNTLKTNVTAKVLPIIAPKETINKGLCKRGYHCEPKYGFASVREYIDYEEYVSADVEKKKKLMLQCVLNSVKTIKTKGRIDFQKFKEDFDVFCKEHRI